MQRLMALSVFLFLAAGAFAQVTLTCPVGGSVTFVFAGANGACLTAAPSNGNIRFALGSSCVNATLDPLSLQSSCNCCAIFNGDCIQYTHTNTGTISDVFVIGGITYTVVIPHVTLNCAPNGSVAFSFSGPNGSCVTTAPANGNIRFALGSNCASTNLDPISLQTACNCCAIFNGDCIRYTNTSPAANDFFVLAGTAYRININSVLPVRFAMIKANYRNESALVEWTTSEALNMERYEIERSADGRDFSVIGSTDAKNGTGETAYAFLDGAPIDGTSFYRIRGTEFSGQVFYSHITKLLITGLPSVEVRPNPIAGAALSVHMKHLPAGAYTISMRNNSGQLVAQKAIDYRGSGVQVLPVDATLPGGLYHLTVEGKGISISTKMIK